MTQCRTQAAGGQAAGRTVRARRAPSDSSIRAPPSAPLGGREVSSPSRSTSLEDVDQPAVPDGDVGGDLLRRIAEVAAARPAAAALVHEGRVTTYADLDRRTSLVASLIRGRA